jgi:hypothetical protein
MNSGYIENGKRFNDKEMHSELTLVIIESPLSGDVEKNKKYACACMAHALKLGEAPFASHLLYAQDGILDDTIPAERTLGIEAGLAWGKLAQKTVVYTDLGISEGMKLGIERAIQEGRVIEYCTLPNFRLFP